MTRVQAHHRQLDGAQLVHQPGRERPLSSPTRSSKDACAVSVWERLLGGEVAGRFLAAVLDRPEVGRLLSDEHFSVDGTLIEAWASMKSFRPKDGPDDGPPAGGRNGERDFHGERRRNDTHASTTDPQARLFRKGLGKEARLSFMGHCRSGWGAGPQPRSDRAI